MNEEWSSIEEGGIWMKGEWGSIEEGGIGWEEKGACLFEEGGCEIFLDGLQESQCNLGSLSNSGVRLSSGCPIKDFSSL